VSPEDEEVIYVVIGASVVGQWAAVEAAGRTERRDHANLPGDRDSGKEILYDLGRTLPMAGPS
jgi:hypothetical protein